ncbi:MAG: carboxy-S-adenosyl-L-methionine synthase CmoA [Nitrospinaceae bacterium]
MKKDNLFTLTAAPEKFEFNASVARVFDDMLERSIPLYRECQEMVIRWAAKYAREGSCVYDLGCSTGTLLSLLAHALAGREGLRLVGVDNSEPMLDKARGKLRNAPLPCQLVCADLNADFPLTGASVVVLNYTLQFLPPGRRPRLAQHIYQGLNPGGCLIAVEKVHGENAELDRSFAEFHDEFKISRGYSQLEISRKREALENVLTPWTLEQNRALLKIAGFASAEVFFKWNNFAGFVALK